MNMATSMWWFDHIFPPAMMLAMPILIQFIPARPRDGSQQTRLRRLQWWLWAIALASVAVYFYVYTAFGGGQWRQLWTLCFLQMPIASRLLAAKNPSYVTAHAGATRVANLSNRSREGIVPRFAWIAAWTLWILLLALAAYGAAVNALPTGVNWMIAAFIAWPALCLSFAPMLVRGVANEPEPMDPANSETLQVAYAKHRRARSWVFFGMAIVFVLVFGSLAVALAWFAGSPQGEANIGLYGGLTGLIVGLIGAGFGIVFGTWRARLNQQVQDLST